MAIGLILTGILNICFGMSSSIVFFAVFWGLNGWFQGWGWPPCAQLLPIGILKKKEGLGGDFVAPRIVWAERLIPIIAAFVLKSWGWRSAMYVPGILVSLLGFFMMNRLRDTPQSLGLPTIEKFKDDYPDFEG